MSEVLGVDPRGTGEPRPVVRLAEVRATALSVDDALHAVAEPGTGGIASFVGTVRDEDGGRAVRALSYSAHPTVDDELRRIAGEVAAAHPEVRGLAVAHRTGDLAVGELAIVVAASAPHRGEAFAACRDLTDQVKEQAPIWKRQEHVDDTTAWIGLD